MNSTHKSSNIATRSRPVINRFVRIDWRDLVEAGGVLTLDELDPLTEEEYTSMTGEKFSKMK